MCIKMVPRSRICSTVKAIVKGGEVSRAVPVNSDGRQAIEDLIAWHREAYRTTHKSRPLFPSRNGQGTKRDVPEDCTRCFEGGF